MGEGVKALADDALGPQEFDADAVRFFEGKMKDALLGLSDELKHLPEQELHDRVNPSEVDWALRQKFHDAIDEARKLGKDRVHLTQIYVGICSKPTFFETYIPNPVKIAFMSRPVIEHTAYYNAIHRECMDKLLRIVKTLPSDSKYLPQILRVMETAGNRVYGPVIQRMQIQSKNVNVELTGKDAAAQAQLPASEDPAEIQKQIETLQSKLLVSAKDVTPKE